LAKEGEAENLFKRVGAKSINLNSMKKILFGSASAILAVIGLSAFKSSKATITYYWLTSADLTTRGQGLINGSLLSDKSGLDQDIAFGTGIKVRSTSSSSTDPYSCGSTGTYCSLAFTASQIVLTTSKTKITGFSGGATTITPAAHYGVN
jgi:hypothetical protein